MEEWLIDDLENEKSEEDNSMAILLWNVMLRKTINPYHLNCFQKRVDY